MADRDADGDVVSRAVDYAAVQLLADIYRDEHGYDGTIGRFLKAGDVTSAIDEARVSYTQEFKEAREVVIENNAAAAKRREEAAELSEIKHNAQQARAGAQKIRDLLF